MTPISGHRLLPPIDDFQQPTRLLIGGSGSGSGFSRGRIDQFEGGVFGELLLDPGLEIGHTQLQNIHRKNQLRCKNLLLFKSTR